MPLVKNIHIDQALTNISRKVKNTSLIADQIWPIVPVKKDSDEYFVYDSANLRAVDTKWARKTKANEIDWEASTEPYKTERMALSQLITDDERQNADTPISVETDTTENLTELMLIDREKKLQTILSTLANFDAGAQPALAAADRWDNFTSASSDPNQDVATARSVIYGKIFRRPNVMVLPYEVYEKVREHPKVQERIKYTQTAIVTADLLAKLWDLEKVLIAGGGENTGAEGAADNLAYIWPKRVWLGWVSPRPALRMPSWGYHLQSKKNKTERWRDDEREGDMFRVSWKETPKLVTQSAGYTIQTVIS
jgi:hypothetical protein